MSKFLVWNIVFIITDMVANVITKTPFTVRSVLLGWFWWNVAFCIVLIVGFPLLLLAKRFKTSLKRLFKSFMGWL